MLPFFLENGHKFMAEFLLKSYSLISEFSVTHKLTVCQWCSRWVSSPIPWLLGLQSILKKDVVEVLVWASVRVTSRPACAHTPLLRRIGLANIGTKYALNESYGVHGLWACISFYNVLEFKIKVQHLSICVIISHLPESLHDFMSMIWIYNRYY